MKTIQYIFIVALSSLLLLSCGSDTKKTKRKKGAKKAMVTKKGQKKKSVKKFDWAAAQKAAGLTKNEVDRLKKSNQNFEAKKTALKKSKKWDGAKNVKTRTSFQKTKINETKKILGKKYQKFEAYKKSLATKKPAKKTVKKKTPAKAKPAKK